MIAVTEDANQGSTTTPVITTKTKNSSATSGTSNNSNSIDNTKTEEQLATPANDDADIDVNANVSPGPTDPDPDVDNLPSGNNDTDDDIKDALGYWVPPSNTYSSGGRLNGAANTYPYIDKCSADNIKYSAYGGLLRIALS